MASLLEATLLAVPSLLLAPPGVAVAAPALLLAGPVVADAAVAESTHKLQEVGVQGSYMSSNQ